MSFSLTRKTDYALVALSKLASRQTNEPKPISARQIAAEQNLPLPLLMNALKQLHRAGLLTSRRGSNGGYALAKNPEHISLRQVIEALEGPVSVTLCSEDPEEAKQAEADQKENCFSCRLVTTCPITDPIQKFNTLLNQFLNEISLQELFNLDHQSVPV